MLSIELGAPKPLQKSDWIRQKPKASQMGRLIDSEGILFSEGKPIGAYLFIDPTWLTRLKAIIKPLTPRKTFRTRGTATSSLIFGVLPRNALRHDHCRIARDTFANRTAFMDLASFGESLNGIYRSLFPEHFQAALEELHDNVHSDWIHSEGPYQTVNVNYNHAIPYHTDSGNFPKAFSTVLILKDHIEGGELVLPEFNVSLSQRDGALLLFEGKRFIHGVMPIHATSPDAFRASVVYYSMQGLRNCLCRKDELSRFETVRTEKEKIPTADVKAKVREMEKHTLDRPKQ